MQRDLARAGADVTIRAYTDSMMYAPVDAGGVEYGGKFNVFADHLYGGLDAEQSDNWTCANRAPYRFNMARWCDPEYDAAFLRQQQTLDRTARTRYFSAMQRRIRDDAVLLPLVEERTYIALNPAVRQFRPGMLYDYWNADQWDVVPKSR